jgi:hypothetical protein
MTQIMKSYIRQARFFQGFPEMLQNCCASEMFPFFITEYKVIMQIRFPVFPQYQHHIITQINFTP